MTRRPSLGFTLIELLVVVVVIAVMMSLVVPAVVSRLQTAPASKPKRAIAQQPLSVVATSDGGRARIERSDVRVRLGTRPFLDGVEVASEYVASFEGEFELSADRAGPVDLVFPLPPGVTEARDVALLVRGEDGFDEPRDVDYSPSAIRWRTAIADRVVVRVRYEAIGRDTFVYDLVGDGRAEVARFVLDVDDEATARIPADALAPTAQDGRRFEWAFDRLVATRPIRVELTGARSPLGRFLALFRFAALGVLLFGAAFWYTSEGDAPGRLDRFRLPHFALLALDYAVFFVVLGVLGLELEAPIALAVASAVGAPLLTLHVARVTEVRYAWTRALPVALVTYAAVVASVLWPAHRVGIWTSVAVASLVFVTVTFRRWSSVREAQRERRRAQREEEEAAAARADAEGALEVAGSAARHALDRARVTQGRTAPDLTLERAELVRCSAELRAELDRVRGEDAVALAATAERIDARRARLDEAMAALDAAHEEAWAALWPALGAVATRSAALRVALDAASGPLEREADSPRVERARARHDAARSVLAHAEDLHARTLAQADTDPREVRPRAIAAEARRLERALAEHDQDVDDLAVTAAHCPACGHGLAGPDPYCGGCGEPAPARFDCGRCGGHLSVPLHVSRRRWKRASLHCPDCGAALRTEAPAAGG